MKSTKFQSKKITVLGLLLLLPFNGICQINIDGRLLLFDSYNNIHIISRTDSIHFQFRYDAPLSLKPLFFDSISNQLMVLKNYRLERDNKKLCFNDLYAYDMSFETRPILVLSNSNYSYYFDIIKHNEISMVIGSNVNSKCDNRKIRYNIRIIDLQTNKEKKRWNFSHNEDVISFHKGALSNDGQKFIATISEKQPFLINQRWPSDPGKVKMTFIYNINTGKEVPLKIKGFNAAFTNKENEILLMEKTEVGSNLLLFDYNKGEKEVLCKSTNPDIIVNYIFNSQRDLILIRFKHLFDDNLSRHYLKLFDLKKKEFLDFFYSLNVDCDVFWLP